MVPERDNIASGWLAEALGSPEEFAKRCGALKGKGYRYFESGQLREIEALLAMLRGIRGRCRSGEVASIYEDLSCCLLCYLVFEAFNKGCYTEHAKLSRAVLDILDAGDLRRSADYEEPWGNTEARLLIGNHVACGMLESLTDYTEAGWDSHALRRNLATLSGRLHSTLSSSECSVAARQSLQLCLVEGWLSILKLDLLHGDAPRKGYVQAINRECGVRLLEDACNWQQGVDHFAPLEYALARELVAVQPDVETVWQLLAAREHLLAPGMLGRPERIHGQELRRLARLLQRHITRKEA